MTFEAALAGRVEHILDACTRCGKCFEACPVKEPAGVAGADPQAVVAGVLEILRSGEGPEASRKWAEGCILSGDCITACDYGVNPRFMLSMARIAMAKGRDPLPEQRRKGVMGYRAVADGVNVIAKLQLTNEQLLRLGQSSKARSLAPAAAAGDERPDFVFYTGCNVLKTPHIALLALDIMDALGVSYRVMGGPSHCCGVVHMRSGDTETTGRMATGTADRLAQGKSGQVLAWCPSCYVQFSETTLPTVEKARGSRPFEMTPFMVYLGSRLDALRPMLRQRVDMRIALHRHPGIPGVVTAAEAILRAVPGVELVDLGQPAVGLMANYFRALPEYRRQLYRAELDAARAAGVDALVAVYHADHRELCAHEGEYPFRIVNLLEIVGESMGLAQADNFKRLKLMQDADAIVEDCRDLIAAHGMDIGEVRRLVETAMLAEQPLPLGGAARA
ncbi:MAG: (Fe-S)-binding protein [Rhizobiales bacterium]|nr:(Fe-S)-binding protein [Hyphomicrobiales bacterium]